MMIGYMCDYVSIYELMNIGSNMEMKQNKTEMGNLYALAFEQRVNRMQEKKP